MNRRLNHYKILLDSLDVGVRFGTKEKEVCTIPMKYNGAIAFIFKKDEMIFQNKAFSTEKINTDFLNQKDLKPLEYSGVCYESLGKTLKRLDGDGFSAWVQEQYLNFFKPKDYSYCSASSLTPVFCYERNSNKLHGLIMPVRIKKNEIFPPGRYELCEQ